MGDLRLAVGAENPDKVRNIVVPHVADFLRWYSGALANLWPIIHVAGDIDGQTDGDLAAAAAAGEDVFFHIDRGSADVRVCVRRAFSVRFFVCFACFVCVRTVMYVFGLLPFALTDGRCS